MSTPQSNDPVSLKLEMKKLEAVLTKRELFAAMALQGWLAGCDNAYSEFTAPGTNTHVAAESAVKFADALMAALEVTK